ncbi:MULTISPECIES: MoxR family ATPase [Rhodomicrobium]|uniref:AAA family ATPase n=1 Tax=Rhodomicrobium TaxID=1068 RepID=UPI000B4B1CDC|nr:MULTISPECIES: MoxR family ATPase [Rhodomicrobium]
MSTPAEIRADLERAGYIADLSLATALAMMRQLGRPLLVEGEAGVGKTELAKALAAAMGQRLIRLQCYEGLDASSALYEWNYQRQILEIRVLECEQATTRDKESRIFSEEFLLKRPLLEAITQGSPPVLLIDEIDRADEEFEAFLLEVLSDYQITIPELGTIRASSIPHVILTSNATRELSNALRRRCLYTYVDYPDEAAELRIVQTRYPETPLLLAGQIVRFVQKLRAEDLRKKPGIAETLDWVAALQGVNISGLQDDPEAVHRTLLCLLKTREDREAVPIEVFNRLAGRAV